MQLLWLDLETTGLDPCTDHILEIAVKSATIEAPFDAAPLYHAVMSWGDLEGLSEFIRDMHTKNGLLAECAGSRAITSDAEDDLLSLVPEASTRAEMPVLAGSSIHFDLSFLRVRMPRFAARLSHRLYDVSAVKMFCQSLGMPPLPKAEAHRASADIDESIAHARACASWVRSGVR